MRHFDVQLIGGDRPPPGQDRRDEDRRGQDPRRDARRGPQRPDRPRRPRRHGQRLPRPARRAVDGPGLPLPRPVGRGHRPRHVVPVRARLPDQRRAADQPAPGHPPRGLRRRHHLRHEQRVRLRLPARQHGHRARAAGPARALLRDRRRGRQHPHRRGADAAHHQRPGRGVGRPLLHVRPPRARASRPRPEGAEEGGDYFVDLKDRAVSPTEEGVDKIEQLLGVANLYDADPRLARHFDQALRAHALYKRDRDYIVKDGEIVIVDEFTGRQMPGRRWSEGLHQAIEAKEGLRVQRESRDPRHDHLPELLPPLRQAGRHDRHGDDRGRGVPQDLQARGRGDPDPPADDPRRRRRTSSSERERQVQRR